MTEFSLEPYRKVTVRSYMRYESAEAFVRAMTLNIGRGVVGRAGNLFWANGILLKHSPYAPTDSVTREYLEGNLPLDHLEYSPMPKFSSEIKVDEIVVTVLDVSNHTLFRALTKWIKDALEKKVK